MYSLITSKKHRSVNSRIRLGQGVKVKVNSIIPRRSPSDGQQWIKTIIITHILKFTGSWDKFTFKSVAPSSSISATSLYPRQQRWLQLVRIDWLNRINQYDLISGPHSGAAGGCNACWLSTTMEKKKNSRRSIHTVIWEVLGFASGQTPSSPITLFLEKIWKVLKRQI